LAANDPSLNMADYDSLNKNDAKVAEKEERFEEFMFG